MPAGEQERMMANELKVTTYVTAVTRAKWLTICLRDTDAILHFYCILRSINISVFHLFFPQSKHMGERSDHSTYSSLNTRKAVVSKKLVACPLPVLQLHNSSLFYYCFPGNTVLSWGSCPLFYHGEQSSAKKFLLWITDWTFHSNLCHFCFSLKHPLVESKGRGKQRRKRKMNYWRKNDDDEIPRFFIIFSYSNQNQVAHWIPSLLFLLSSEKILHVILQYMVRKLK